MTFRPGRRTTAKSAGWAFLAAVAMLAFFLPRIAAATDQHAAIGGPFALIDHNGRPVTDADFAGKFMLVYFGYTSCPDACPTALYEIGQAIDQLTPGERSNIAPIFITVDPDHDTPKVLADYLSSFSPYLVGLTGSPDAIRDIEREFHVYANKHSETDGSYSVDHSSVIYLMDRTGKYRAILTGNSTAAQIVGGLRKLF